MIPKYRAYNKRLSLMREVLSIDLHPELGGVEVQGESFVDHQTAEPLEHRDFWPWSEIELMICTPLTDKDGKETYEGDLLAHRYPAGETLYEARINKDEYHNVDGLDFYYYGVHFVEINEYQRTSGVMDYPQASELVIVG